MTKSKRIIGLYEAGVLVPITIWWDPIWGIRPSGVVTTYSIWRNPAESRHSDRLGNASLRHVHAGSYRSFPAPLPNCPTGPIGACGEILVRRINLHTVLTTEEQNESWRHTG